MEIKGDDYIITPVKGSYTFFDVDLLKTINAGKSNEREEFYTEAYGVTLEGAIKLISHYLVQKKHKDQAIHLAEYIKDLVKFKEDIQKDLSQSKIDTTRG